MQNETTNQLFVVLGGGWVGGRYRSGYSSRRYWEQGGPISLLNVAMEFGEIIRNF